MVDGYDWLPELIEFSGIPEEISGYFDDLHDLFITDFIKNKPVINGKIVKIRSMPSSEGKIGMFWYLTHDHPEGYIKDEEWIPNFHRCKRIRWIRVIIEAYSRGCDDIVYWEEPRGRDTRLHIALEDFSYLVVLSARKSNYILWTAYFVERINDREKLEKRYAKHK